MLVSALIPTRNNYTDLKKCLQSLAEQKLPSDCRLEILIIDNGSEDNSTLRIKSEFPNYSYILNRANRGFSAAINQGLRAQATSDYFLLINNDAFLEPEALKKLLAARADLTGPTIFYADQPEKVWQAGGEFKKLKLGVKVPLKNQFLTLEEKNKLDQTSDYQAKQAVSFLSACVLLISQNALKKIGLFDENFFFYGEDLDFSWRAHQAGLKISYLPDAQAWHNIKDITLTRTNPFVLENLARAYFLIIRKHFSGLLTYGLFLFIFFYTPFRVWQIIKGGQPLKNISAWFKGAGQGLRIKIGNKELKNPADKAKLLLVTTRPPRPALDGTRLHVLNRIEALAKNWRVDIFITSDEKISPENRAELEKLGGGQVFDLYQNKYWRGLKAALALGGKSPLQKAYFNSRTARRTLKKIASGYQLFYCHTLRPATLFLAAAKSQPEIISKTILDFNDAISLNYESASQKARGFWRLIYAREKIRIKNYELYLLKTFPYFTILSVRDKNWLLKKWQEKYQAPPPEIKILPYGLEDKYLNYSWRPENKNLVFIGNLNYPPNRQGLELFCRSVWPLIRQNSPTSELIIIGRGREKLNIRADGVKLIGWLDEPHELMCRQAAFLNPITFGAGVSTKTILALALGLPIISTPNGLAGIESLGSLSTETNDKNDNLNNHDKEENATKISGVSDCLDYSQAQRSAEQILKFIDEISAGDRQSGLQARQALVRSYYLKSQNDGQLLDYLKSIAI